MLEVRNLSKTFNKDTENEIQIFDRFNVHIEKGKCTALLGSNGCGKSTFMNMVSGSIMQDGGEIILDGQVISNLKEDKRAIHIGKFHQNPSLGVSPSLTILENMSLADKKGERFGIKKLINIKNIEKYREILKELDLGLENKLSTKVKFLSGGQRQALSLCMATMKSPKILLLDEHTAALDPKTSTVIMEKTRELIERKKITTIMISHNMRDAIEYSDRVIMLDRGNIILDKDSKTLTEQELTNIYTEKLLDFNKRKLAC